MPRVRRRAPARLRRDVRALSAPAERSAYRPELDWLRFFAFGAVFLHHALPQEAGVWAAWLPGGAARWVAGAVRSGGYGVDLFLALSAFLITELLLREAATFGRIDVLSFYVRRILRIWPLYYSFVALTALAGASHGLLPGKALTGAALACFLTFVANWFCAFHGTPGTIADPLWSVSIEEQFYLSWPPLLALAGVRHLKWLCLALIGTSWITRAVVIAGGAPHPAIWCNTLARLDPIAAGVALAAIVPRLRPISGPARVALVLFGCAGIVDAGVLDAFHGPRALIGYPVVAVSCGLLLLAFLGMPAPKSRALSALAYLGKISYGLYVFHVLGIQTAARLLSRLPFPLQAALGFLITLALAAASYRFLESPFLRLKQRFTRVPSRPADA